MSVDCLHYIRLPKSADLSVAPTLLTDYYVYAYSRAVSVGPFMYPHESWEGGGRMCGVGGVEGIWHD